MSSTTVVAQFTYRHEAEIAVGFLQDRGIEAAVFADDAGGLHPGLGFTRPARVLVSSQDAESARRTLTDAGMLPDEAVQEEESTP